MIPGAPFTDLATANAAAVAWCAEVNGRVHSETSAVPAERLAAERPLLRPLPSLRPAPAPTAVRTVDRLRTVRYGSARYSVPGAFIGDAGSSSSSPAGELVVTAAGAEIARHRLVGPGELSLVDAHYGRAATAPVRAIRPRTPAEIAFLGLGPVAAAFLRAAAAAGTPRLAGELALIVDLERSPRPRAAPRGPRAGARVPPLPGRGRPLDPRRRTGVPRHREPGERLAIALPAVPVRPLAAYALEPVA